MEKLEIFYMKTADLIPYEKNPRRNDKAVAPVAESIKQFGFRSPIVVDKDNVVVAGHTRLRAAKRLHLKEVPCARITDLSEDQIKAFRLADNRTAEFAEWDMDLLNSELLAIDGVDMSTFGFEEPEPEPEEDGFDLDGELEKIDNPATKPGTLYQLGSHRLLCGDSTKAADVQRLMDGALVDMVFTDPPYNVAYEGGTKDKLTIQNDNMSAVQFKNFLDAVFKNYDMAMKAGAPFYVCYASRSALEFRQAIIDAGLLLKEDLVWCKNSFTLGRQDYQWQHEPILYGWKGGAKHKWYGGRKMSTVIPDNYPIEISQDADGGTLININLGLKTYTLKAADVKAVDAESCSSVIFVDKPKKNGDHPTMKPIALCAKCIKNSSQQGDKVLDLFGGSGSTLIACEQINRECYSMELDPKYCDVIVKRWEALTGRTAEVISG